VSAKPARKPSSAPTRESYDSAVQAIGDKLLCAVEEAVAFHRDRIPGSSLSSTLPLPVERIGELFAETYPKLSIEALTYGVLNPQRQAKIQIHKLRDKVCEKYRDVFDLGLTLNEAIARAWDKIMDSPIVARRLPESPQPATGTRKHKTSEFERFAGELWRDTIASTSEHRVSSGQLESIARQLDGSKFNHPLRYLEPAHRGSLATYNRNHPRAAIKSWAVLARSSRFSRGMRRALSRAAGKLSACPPGQARTTF